MRCKLLVLILSLCATAAATTQHEVFNNAVPFVSTTNDILGLKGLDRDKAALDNPATAMVFIEKMKTVQTTTGKPDQLCPLTDEEKNQKGKDKRAPGCLPDLNGKNPNTYVLIHLLRWDDSSAPDKAKVHADHWYVYRDATPGKWSQEDFTTAKRVLGVKRVYLLYVQFKGQLLGADGKPSSQPVFVPSVTPDYDVTVTKKTPANVAHLYALLQAYTGGSSGALAKTPPSGREALAGGPDAVWGGGVLNLQYRPSDILIKSTFQVNPVNSDTTAQTLTADITFDNEGPYWWDVGFAVPVKKISELKLDSTSGTATPANVSSESVFSVFDFYFPPVDVKGSAFTAIPHPIAGVAFAKQPLHKILIGGAWGPKVSEIYAGALFVKQPNLSGSNSCSKPSGASFTGDGHWCTQFSVGINLSVSAIASKLGAPK